MSNASSPQSPQTAIVCASGGFKGVFVSGVLAAFEQAGLRAAAYGAVSSTVLPAACAAIGRVGLTDPDYWHKGANVLDQPGRGMSEVVLGGIGLLSATIQKHLFQPEAPRMVVVTSAVITPEAAEQTQGDKARRLGQQLLLLARRNDKSWVEQNLALRLFDTAASGDYKLDAGNFGAVTYASTRMLHAWRTPASVCGQPFIDGSYTCSCPALEMIDLGFHEIIAINTEAGPLEHDLFSRAPLPDVYHGGAIFVISPDHDLKQFGVDFTGATLDGLKQAYQHGIDKGREFVAKHS